MFPMDDPSADGADQLLDHGTSPLSAGLPPPANTGATLPGPLPQTPPPAGLDSEAMMQGAGAMQPPQEGALNGGDQLTAAHGEALRGMAQKLASLMGRR